MWTDVKPEATSKGELDEYLAELSRWAHNRARRRLGTETLVQAMVYVEQLRNLMFPNLQIRMNL